MLMRDYYEPHLLPRVLACSSVEQSDPKACQREFKPVRPLASLNRVQPVVVVNAVWLDASTGVAKVTVVVRSHSDPEMKNGKTFTKPYDVPQRAFCARLILRRPAADIVRDVPLELLPSAARAASMRWS
jgi:hypothetical protein